MDFTPVAVIFDMDGLLLDSEPVWHEAERELARLWGAEWTEEDARACTGRGIPGTAARLAEVARRPFDAEAHPRLLVDTFLARADKVGPKPGARAIVRRLRALDVPLGLGSSSPLRVVATLLGAQGLDGEFSAIVTADDVEHVKPEPHIFLRCAELLGVVAASCVVIEDSFAGVTAAKRAGMRVIAVPDTASSNTKHLHEAADIVAQDLDSASGLLAEWLSRR
jgi:HAD superfamily hydrolase (TIGR01509 family)